MPLALKNDSVNFTRFSLLEKNIVYFLSSVPALELAFLYAEITGLSLVIL